MAWVEVELGRRALVVLQPPANPPAAWRSTYPACRSGLGCSRAICPVWTLGFFALYLSKAMY